MYKHILLPTDGSERSARAISAGLQLAEKLNARVTGLYVEELTYIQSIDENHSPKAISALKEFEHQASQTRVEFKCVTVKDDAPQNAIVNFAVDKGCDLIIMGTHGRSRVGKLFLGSSAAAVLAECDIPLLLYR